MLLSSNNAKKNFDFIVSVFYFVVLLCKDSAFMLVGQEMRWFLLVHLRLSFESTLHASGKRVKPQPFQCAKVHKNLRICKF